MEIVEKLKRINWDFSDFTSTKYPYDLNSIPWYPATFISPIPRTLISSLSEEEDIVLDPFGGKGTTAIEATLQNRIPLYCDLNPFAVENTEGLFAAIEYVLAGVNSPFVTKEELREKVSSEERISDQMLKYRINQDAVNWFHKNTLSMILAIIESIDMYISIGDRKMELIGKLAFSSILKSASSQKGHFTYVTDNCKPAKDELREKDAIGLYVDKIEQILRAAREFITQFNLLNPDVKLSDLLQKRHIVTGNAKDLSWIGENTVDLVVTSPPYLCSQDYIKTMRLMNLFFENQQAFDIDVKHEIGARALRGRKSEVVVYKFYEDMRDVFAQMNRVLKKDGSLALVVGQGKSKTVASYNIVSDLDSILQDEFGFERIFMQERKIGKRVIQVGGVDKESVLVFKKRGDNK